LAKLQHFLDYVPSGHALHIHVLNVSTTGHDTQAACSDALSPRPPRFLSFKVRQLLFILICPTICDHLYVKTGCVSRGRRCGAVTRSDQEKTKCHRMVRCQQPLPCTVHHLPLVVRACPLLIKSMSSCVTLPLDLVPRVPLHAHACHPYHVHGHPSPTFSLIPHRTHAAPTDSHPGDESDGYLRYVCVTLLLKHPQTRIICIRVPQLLELHKFRRSRQGIDTSKLNIGNVEKERRRIPDEAMMAKTCLIVWHIGI
jgi:hypothetical protein